MAPPGRRDFVRDDGSDRTDRPPRGADAEGEMIEDSGESSSASSSMASSHEAGRRAGVRGGLAESLVYVLNGELDGHATIEGEHWVLRWLQALDLQVLGACRADERMKPLFKVNASSGAAEDRFLAQISQHFEVSEVGMLTSAPEAGRLMIGPFWGRYIASHGLLQQGNAEYDAKRQALYDYYHPLEISPSIPIEEKTKLMEEWWEKTHALLIEGGLTYDAIKSSVTEATIAFRDGVIELFEILEERGVPILIFSAGLADIIEEVFRQKLHRSFRNIKVVSNRMVFDEKGCLIAFKGKTIHVLNKNEHALDMAAPIHDKMGDPNGSTDESFLVKTRTNVLLLGDHIGDLGMSDGLNYEDRIAVGFLNGNVEKSLKSYLEAFDVVYLNDSSMKGVIDLVSQLCCDDN